MKYDFRKIAESHLDQLWAEAEATTQLRVGTKEEGLLTTEQRFINFVNPNTVLAIAIFELCDQLKKGK